MTNYMKIAIVLCACLALATAQFGYGNDFDNFFGTSFGAPSLGGLSSAAANRDPRANRGPVVFPPSPPGDPTQTSGVRVGASGYGFVPAAAPGNGRYEYGR